MNDERWSEVLDAIELDLSRVGVTDLTDRLLSWTPPTTLSALPASQADRAATLLEQIRTAEQALAARQARVREELDNLVRRHPGAQASEPVRPQRLDRFA